MADSLHPYYLQVMGIEQWKMRPTPVCNDQPNLTDLAQQVAACTHCSLHKTRTNTVFSRGNPKAKLMIIGEAPGFHEDKQGLPFVGKAGALLNRMLQSIEMTEQDVYIANVLKCRPPNNRDPKSDEIAQCSHYLAMQVQRVAPCLILGLGRFAGQFLVGKPTPLNQLREKLFSYQQTPVMVSYHPAYLLRQPADKKKAFMDLRRVKQLLMELSCIKKPLA